MNKYNNNLSRCVSEVPTKMQMEIMLVIENLCESLKETRERFPYPTRTEIYKIRSKGKIHNLTTMLRGMINKGWLERIRYELSPDYAYYPTNKWTKTKDIILSDNADLIKTEVNKSRMIFKKACSNCGKESKLTVYRGEELCRDCLCPDIESSIEDIILIESNMKDISNEVSVEFGDGFKPRRKKASMGRPRKYS